MEYAYNTLLESGHKDIKDSIMKSYEHYLNYADNESNVVAAVKASNAFENENIEYSETVSYGTISLIERSSTLAKLYKERALELRSYLDELGIHKDYVFDEKNISDEEQKLFHK